MSQPWRISGETATYHTRVQNSSGGIHSVIMAISWENSPENLEETERRLTKGLEQQRLESEKLAQHNLQNRNLVVQSGTDPGTMRTGRPFPTGFYARLTMDGNPAAMLQVEPGTPRPSTIRDFTTANDPETLCRKIFHTMREIMENPGRQPQQETVRRRKHQ